MQRGLWIWRLGFALVGIGVYWLLFPSALQRPVFILYDIAAIGIVCSLGGSLVGRLVAGRLMGGDSVRALALLVCVLVGFGVEYGGWPFSGHLTAALAAGMIEAGDRGSPLWFRTGALAPAAVVVLIRTLWPQIPEMGIHAYTASGLLLGTAIGVLALLPIRQRERNG